MNNLERKNNINSSIEILNYDDFLEYLNNLLSIKWDINCLNSEEKEMFKSLSVVEKIREWQMALYLIFHYVEDYNFSFKEAIIRTKSQGFIKNNLEKLLNNGKKIKVKDLNSKIFAEQCKLYPDEWDDFDILLENQNHTRKKVQDSLI